MKLKNLNLEKNINKNKERNENKMKFNYLKLAEIIKEKRMEKEISTRELGEKIGISHAEISRFENGLKANFYLIPFIKMCKELKIELFDLLEDVGLYETDFDKLFYVMFKGTKENIYKIHARNEIEAMQIAYDFVTENNLIEVDEKLENILIGVVENIEDFNQELIKRFEESNQLIEDICDDTDDELDDEIEYEICDEYEPDDENCNCDTCKHYCHICEECTFGE